MAVAGAIKQNAPDDVHMAQRYAAILDILVHAALQNTGVDRPNGSLPVESSGFLNIQEPLSDYVDPAAAVIYDQAFWDSLPDMVGLSSVSNLFMPSFQ